MRIQAPVFDDSSENEAKSRTLSWNIPMAGGAKVSKKTALSKTKDSKLSITSSERNTGKENLQRRSADEVTSTFGIIGISPAMTSIYHTIKMVGRTTSSVLITGESGVGKELVARAVHNTMAGGKTRPFVPINCGAMPAGLMESELFGHEKGAFTGAQVRKTGKAELADGGTLFLDEIATMPLHLQVKLLRFVQDRTFTRVGGNKVVDVDIRVIAAANTNLREAVAKGEFREDLFYRLNVVPIVVPPLRERDVDISLLAEFFLKKYTDKHSRRIKGISAGAMRALTTYSWPGNVRELENIMERLVVLAADKNLISGADLPAEILSGREEQVEESFTGDFKAAVKSFEHSYITALLEKTGWNRVETARLMKVHRNTLLMKMKSLHIKIPAKSQHIYSKSSPYRAGSA
ncbi:MAG: sigma-54 interaction domain-containing protein [Thermodesulfobacteriota bacterium]